LFHGEEPVCLDVTTPKSTDPETVGLFLNTTNRVRASKSRFVACSISKYCPSPLKLTDGLLPKALSLNVGAELSEDA